MNAEVGPCATFYDSALQHPVLLWLAAGSALVFCLLRPGLAVGLRRYCAALAILSLFDAWLTAHHVLGLGALPESLRSAVPFGFVLAGDARFLLLLAAATPRGELRLSPRAVAQALLLSLVVPCFTQVALGGLPESLAGPRVMYLIYEVAFVGLTLGLLRWHPQTRAAPWLRGVCRFVILYYSLWALADSLILFSGLDAGFALRVVPNLLYYGGLIAAIAWLAPSRPDPRAAV